jgi:glutathione S-transferase
MTFTLYYLPFRARAEQIRMILSYGNVPYENVVITPSEWTELKASREICPFGQLPTIKLESGEIIAQSGAIVRFAAKLAGLYPADFVEAARADMVFELAQEMNVICPILNFWPMRSELWQKNHDAYYSNLPLFVEAARKILDTKPFFGGQNPCFADFSMFHIIDLTLVVQPSSLNAFPTILQWYTNMRGLPSLAKYLSERPGDSSVGFCGSFIQVASGNIHH